MNMILKSGITASLVAATLFGAGCQTTVKIEPSDKPIIINLNVNIQQEIRVRLDKDIEDLLADNPDVF